MNWTKIRTILKLNETRQNVKKIIRYKGEKDDFVHFIAMFLLYYVLSFCLSFYLSLVPNFIHNRCLTSSQMIKEKICDLVLLTVRWARLLSRASLFFHSSVHCHNDLSMNCGSIPFRTPYRTPFRSVLCRLHKITTATATPTTMARSSIACLYIYVQLFCDNIENLAHYKQDIAYYKRC